MFMDFFINRTIILRANENFINVTCTNVGLFIVINYVFLGNKILRKKHILPIEKLHFRVV